MLEMRSHLLPEYSPFISRKRPPPNIRKASGAFPSTLSIPLTEFTATGVDISREATDACQMTTLKETSAQCAQGTTFKWALAGLSEVLLATRLRVTGYGPGGVEITIEEAKSREHCGRFPFRVVELTDMSNVPTVKVNS